MKVWHISYPCDDTPSGYAYEWFPSESAAKDRIADMKENPEELNEYNHAKDSISSTYIPTSKKEMLQYLNNGWYFIAH